jgi:hypothetical protein
MSTIRGTEGLTPADIQNEIARGARFVAYQWCISLLVVTLKRGTRIYYLKPGQTGFLPGFLWSAFTLVAGWWGFPWGPIYTIGSLWTNLRGGIDVTAAVSADLANTHGAPAVPTLTGTAAPRCWNTGPLAAIGALATALFVFAAGGHHYSQQHRPVALVNGLDQPYSISIDGVDYSLHPHQVSRIELPAGTHAATTTLPGGVGETRFSFTVSAVAAVNPDGAALVAEETTIYTPDSSPRVEGPKPRIHSGETAYALAEPDFFLGDFPESIQMSSGASQMRRTRVGVYADLAVGQCAQILQRDCGRPAMVAYLRGLGDRLPENTDVLGAAVELLEPAEAKTFFTRYLSARPVLVEWHRAYQNFQRSQHLDTEIAVEYRQLAEANPDDGAFAYLYGRLLDNAVDDASWFERALAAKRPCAHAHFALAYNAAARGDFAEALAGLGRANAAGLDNDTIRGQRIECLLALGRPTDALRELRKKPAAKADFSRANEELHLAFLAGGKSAAKQVVDTFLARLSPETRRQSGAEIRKSFDAQIAYYEGDLRTFAESIPADATGFAAVTRAICLRDHAAAYRTLVDTSAEAIDGVGQLLLYLSASLGKETDAELYWRFLISTWSRAGSRHARLAAHFNGTAKLTDAELLDYPMSPAEKRLVLAAIGLHEPKLRAAAFARAKQCDFSRQFPHHLVAAALATR